MSMWTRCPSADENIIKLSKGPLVQCSQRGACTRASLCSSNTCESCAVRQYPVCTDTFSQAHHGLQRSLYLYRKRHQKPTCQADHKPLEKDTTYVVLRALCEDYRCCHHHCHLHCAVLAWVLVCLWIYVLCEYGKL
jgi:hypothetical protein